MSFPAWQSVTGRGTEIEPDPARELLVRRETKTCRARAPGAIHRIEHDPTYPCKSLNCDIHVDEMLHS